MNHDWCPNALLGILEEGLTPLTLPALQAYMIPTASPARSVMRCLLVVASTMGTLQAGYSGHPPAPGWSCYCFAPCKWGPFPAGHGNCSVSEKELTDRSSQTHKQAGEAFPRTGTSIATSSTAPQLLHQTKCSPHRCTSSPWWQQGCHWHREIFFLLVTIISEEDSSTRQVPSYSGTSFPVPGMAVPLGRQITIQLVDGLISPRCFCSPLSLHWRNPSREDKLDEQKELGYLLKNTGERFHFLASKEKNLYLVSVIALLMYKHIHPYLEDLAMLPPQITSQWVSVE